MKESPAIKYQKFIESKPTKIEYQELQESLKELLKKQYEIDKMLIKIDKLIISTRKVLNEYKNLV